MKYLCLFLGHFFLSLNFEKKKMKEGSKGEKRI
jgi:hypothetical protein